MTNLKPNLSKIAKNSLLLICFLLFFNIAKSQVFASCIPPSQNVSGCTFRNTFVAWCDGLHFIKKDPPTMSCKSGSAEYIQYACGCQFRVDAYTCSGGYVREAYTFLSSEIYSPTDYCYPDIQQSNVSYEIATNPTLCKQWCYQPPLVQPSPIPTPTLACPNIIGISCISGGKVHLMWRGVPNAYSYRIYRNDVYRGQATTNTYNDTGLKCGVKYSYDVKPFQSGGSERNCQQNYLITCSCPKIPTPPPPNRR